MYAKNQSTWQVDVQVVVFLESCCRNEFQYWVLPTGLCTACVTVQLHGVCWCSGHAAHRAEIGRMQGRLRRIYNSFCTGVEKKVRLDCRPGKKASERRGESGLENHDEGKGEAN